MKNKNRIKNECKYENWEETQKGGRRYWYDVKGRFDWFSRYIKEVNENEVTVRFYQEIYNEKGKIVEFHEKFPIDKGHQKIQEE